MFAFGDHVHWLAGLCRAFFFFFNYRNGFSLRVVYLCRAGPVFVPVFFLCIWKAEAQQLFQPAQPRSCTACLIPQKTFGTLHNQHISSSISTNLCILLGRAAGFCRLVRAAEKVKRIPHNSVYFPRAWPIKGLHFCRFHKVLVKFSWQPQESSKSLCDGRGDDLDPGQAPWVCGLRCDWPQKLQETGGGTSIHPASCWMLAGCSGCVFAKQSFGNSSANTSSSVVVEPPGAW